MPTHEYQVVNRFPADFIDLAVNICPRCKLYPFINRFALYDTQLKETRVAFEITCNCRGSDYGMITNYRSSLKEAVDAWNKDTSFLFAVAERSKKTNAEK